MCRIQLLNFGHHKSGLTQMNSFNFTEAEIQLLIALIEIEDPVETPNNNFYRFYPENLEQAAKYFRKYREDWTEAYSSLSSLELIHKIKKKFQLTPKGKDVAEYLRNNRPPIWYWYKEFYSDASQSQAYRLFCEELYGKYLCQQSFSDMRQIDAMIQIANFSSKSKVLELGCGTGMLAEYISDKTKAFVHGIDYSPDAIEIARNRTRSKSGFLAFSTGNMDSLHIEPYKFDTIISVDSLYMPQNLYKTMASIGNILTPDGQIFVFYSIFISPDDSRELLMRIILFLQMLYVNQGLCIQLLISA